MVGHFYSFFYLLRIYLQHNVLFFLSRSVNEVICHGIPDARPFENGDIVNIDITVYTADGFHSDLNETFIVGDAVDTKGRKLVQCAYECLRAAVAVCRPGVMYQDLGKPISKAAKEAGFSVVTSYCGHGIGRLFHCAPNVPHYARNKAVGIMKPGHIFTIEPMINEGSSSDELWPDDWTAVTSDGKRSAQFEHTLLVTETGVEILTSRIGTQKNIMPEWKEADVFRPLEMNVKTSVEETTTSTN
jgi:methionyl aminopeptidase